MTIESVMAQLEILDQVIKDMRLRRHRLVIDLGEGVAALVHIPPASIYLGQSWTCENSPTKHCIYDTDKDPCHDQCVICGDPEERK